MPKGRCFVPHTPDGLWFNHPGLKSNLFRESATSTGAMLIAPFSDAAAAKPHPPPKPYTEKDSQNFKDRNIFSAHDNRHSFQDHGIYFGNGQCSRSLGKRMTAHGFRHHHTDSGFLEHRPEARAPVSDSLYAASYQSRGPVPRPDHRRFPTQYPEGAPGLAKLTTTATKWFAPPDVPHATPTHVLAVSQEPFLTANKWKYSYHGSAGCYPSYRVRGTQQRFSQHWTPAGNQRLPAIEALTS